eukprot:TRINITY_DN5341_c0_g1_i1.p1 TRINITY_DN5341_c0_g1~~TRINITY_DN5341_c0_g1_i1.p1  ORF type:complete len:179 (-),score=54.43 TRINITY_DN5341_c0_g1_i1:307-843(-)
MPRSMKAINPMDPRKMKRDEAREEAKNEAKQSKSGQELPDSDRQGRRRKAKSKPWPHMKTAITVGVIFVLLIVASFFFPVGSSKGQANKGVLPEAFAKKAPALVRGFIKSNYGDYGKGKVTLRDMKQHIVDKGGFNLTYEDLANEAYGSIIKGEADAIVARCEGGKLPVSCIDPKDEV